jgi:protein tyrosine phosphatase (PTP) superfamily phosphohydrolase (DUF442 family)
MLGIDEPTESAPVYVTSPILETDKLASMWLIQRFLQQDATFRFVGTDPTLPGGIPFDTPKAEFRRHGKITCFESILNYFDVSDPALLRFGELMHDIEINYWGEKRYDESIELNGEIMRIVMDHPDDPLVCRDLAFSSLDTWYERTKSPLVGVAESGPEFASDSVRRLRRVGDGLYVSGQPVGDAAFTRLKELGIRTIINVDGSDPNIAGARAHGMRYVHIPIGYTDVSRAKVLRIIKAARTMPGSVLIHCHRGQHRAPTAAALVAMTSDAWTNEEGVRFLESSGTSPQYESLYELVGKFVPPSTAELAGVEDEFPEVADLGSLSKVMAEIDVHWSHLETTRQSDFSTPANHPDLNPAHEAMILRDLLHRAVDIAASEEAYRNIESRMAETEASAGELLTWLDRLQPNGRRNDLIRVKEAFSAVDRKCTACHKRYRD